MVKVLCTARWWSRHCEGVVHGKRLQVICIGKRLQVICMEDDKIKGEIVRVNLVIKGLYYVLVKSERACVHVSCLEVWIR